MARITKEELYRMYVEEQMSIPEIARTLGMSQSGVSYYLKKYNIPRRTRSEGYKVWVQKVCEQPYDTITPELAYIYGVYLGDGHVSWRPGNYRFMLNVDSHTFIDSVATALQALDLNPKVYKYPSTASLICHSKRLCKWLCETPVSDALSWSQEAQREFVRGIYESEGSCVKYNYSWKLIVAYNTNEQLIDVVQQILQSQNFDVAKRAVRMYYKRKNREYVLYHLQIRGGRSEVRRCLCWLRPCIKWPEELR